MFEHWGDTVYWDSMSWEAFAAIAAFIAAGFVGWRQVGIAKRQSEIQALELKAALWDRRMAIYDTTRSFLSHIALKGRVPGRGTALSKVSGRPPAGLDLASQFNQAVDRGQFLLSAESSRRLQSVQRTADRLADIHEDPGAFYEPQKSELEAEAKVLRAQLVEHYNAVAAIFGEDLVLRER